MERLKMIRGSDNIFRDLGFDKAEAENLKMRSQLMMRIEVIGGLIEEVELGILRQHRRDGEAPPLAAG